MSKFVVVTEAPTELRKGEYVIERPTFMAEVEATRGRRPHNGLMGSSYLRTVVGLIGEKYDPTLTSWNIRPHLYEARPFATDGDVSAMVVDLLKSQHPTVFDGYLNTKIKQRPVGTKVIYYVGNFTETKPFFDNGIDQIDLKDVDVELGLKTKKVVGKPAITNDEAKGS